MSPLWTGVVAHYIGFDYYTEWGHNAITSYAGGYEEPKYISLYSVLRNNNRSLLKCPGDNLKNIWGTDLAVTYGWNGGANGMGAHDAFYLPTYNAATQYSFARQRRNRIAQPTTTIMLGDWAKDDGTSFYEYRYHYQLNLPTELSDDLHAHVGTILWADGHASGDTQDSLAVDDNGNGSWDYFSRYE